jgi:hypothetical protein
MKVVFRTNLGSIDAAKFELDHTKCKVGDTVDVKKEHGEELIKLGIAVASDKADEDELVKSHREQEERRAAAADPGVRAVAREPDIKSFKNNPHAPKLPD